VTGRKTLTEYIQPCLTVTKSQAFTYCEYYTITRLDGVFTGGHAAQARPRFQRVKAPDRAELEQLVYTISERTGRYLERQGLLVRHTDTSYLAL
jgi:hypothetical protein